MHTGGVFECSICHWSERYHGHGMLKLDQVSFGDQLTIFVGSSISFARAVTFNEDAYVMRDPFVPWAQNAFVFLGAACSICLKPVCVNCSVFYAKRFCIVCASDRLRHFPVEVQKKIQQLTKTK